MTKMMENTTVRRLNLHRLLEELIGDFFASVVFSETRKKRMLKEQLKT